MRKLILLMLIALTAVGSLFAFDPSTLEVPEKGEAKMFEKFERDLKKAEVKASNNPTNPSAINQYLKLVARIDSKMIGAIDKIEKKTKDSCRFDKSLMYFRELQKYNESIKKINEIYASVGALVPKTSSPVNPSFQTDVDVRIQEATRLTLDVHYLAALDIEQNAKKVSDKEASIPHYLRILDLDPEYKDVAARCDAMIKIVTMNTILVIDDRFNEVMKDDAFTENLIAELKTEAGSYSQYFTKEDLVDFAAAKSVKDYFSPEKMQEFATANDLGSVGAVVVLMNVESKVTEPREKVKKIDISRYVLPDGSIFKEKEWEDTAEKVKQVGKELEKAKKKGMSDSEIDLAFQADNPQLFATYKSYNGHLSEAKKETVAVLEMVTSTRNFNLEVRDAYLLTDFTQKRPKTTKLDLDFESNDSIIWYRLDKGSMEDLKKYAPEYAEWYASNRSSEGLKTEADFIQEIKSKVEKKIPELVLREMRKIKR